MSQEAVEQVLGRMITDEKFRHSTVDSLETSCLNEGYLLSKGELCLLSTLKQHVITEFAAQLDPNLCRARSTAK